MEITASKASPFRAVYDPMDAAALFLLLNTEPTLIDSRAISMRGGMTPIILPVSGLPPATLARLVINRQDLPLEHRVSAALAADDTASAWQLIIRSAGAAHRNIAVSNLLSHWSAKELDRLKLKPTRDVVLLLSNNDRIHHTMQVATTYNIIQEMLSGLRWPRWTGPLIVVMNDIGEQDPYPGIDQIMRPALPMVRMSPATPGITQSEALGVHLTTLTLALEAPPAAGWPAWLSVGLNEVAKAKIRGEGPSPLKMHSIRQEAGLKRLEQLFSDEKPDATLAMAVCAPLVHSRRRHLLGNLLDLLRGGAASPGAIHVAYGLTLNQLLQER
jgi:hypothetical protein